MVLFCFLKRKRKQCKSRNTITRINSKLIIFFLNDADLDVDVEIHIFDSYIVCITTKNNWNIIFCLSQYK